MIRHRTYAMPTHRNDSWTADVAVSLCPPREDIL